MTRSPYELWKRWQHVKAFREDFFLFVFCHHYFFFYYSVQSISLHNCSTNLEAAQSENALFYHPHAWAPKNKGRARALLFSGLKTCINSQRTCASTVQGFFLEDPGRLSPGSWASQWQFKYTLQVHPGFQFETCLIQYFDQPFFRSCNFLLAFWIIIIFIFFCRFYAFSFSLYFSKVLSHADLIVISFESNT